MSARVTWPSGSRSSRRSTVAQAATPPPTTITATTAADEDGAPVAGSAPARCADLGTATPTRPGPPPPGKPPPPKPPPPKPPVVQVPPVEVIRTVVAVTAPLVAAGPNALTQSPTARSVEAADWVALTVVELDGRDLELLGLGRHRLLGLVLLESSKRGLAKLPSDMAYPETLTVDPLTPVTLPDAMDSLASAAEVVGARATAGEARTGPARSALAELVRRRRRAGSRPPPGTHRRRRRRRRRGRRTRCTIPLDAGVVTVMVRAAMVVLDFFDAVPVTVTQSPAASALTASVTVLENCVVVRPARPWSARCWRSAPPCSMPLSAATLPDAPLGRLGGGARRGAGGRRRQRHERGGSAPDEACPAPPVRASAGRCLHLVRSSFSFACLVVIWRCTVRLYSLRRASIGARVRGPAGGVHAEEDADGQGDGERPDGGRGARGDGVADQAGQIEHAEEPADHAEDAADQAEHGGLDEELAPDDPGRGAERLAQPDLADSLGDRHQHDVHDADAADDERDGGDAPEQDGQRVVHRGVGGDERRLRGDREVGVGRRGDPVQLRAGDGPPPGRRP